MGGGGVIRTVGKVAGIGAAASRGLRGNQPAPVAEHSARSVSRKVASIVSSNNGAVSAGDVSPVSVQRPAWEIDDWEFAGEEGDPVMSSGEPMPRVVFGAAPSFEEARAATDELKDALEKVYLSSPAAAESGSSTPLGHPSDQPLLSDSELESKHLIFNEPIIAPPAPKHAVQAFKLLTQSPAAQNVVASIASDPNVWHALWQNEALVDFLQTQKSTDEFPCDDLNMKNSVEDGGAPQDAISIKSFDKSAGDSNSGNTVNASKPSGLFQYMKHAMEDAVEGVKRTVEELVSNVSGLFQHIFGVKADGKADTGGGKEDGGSTFMETTVQQSLLGLAVLVILVVVLKRV